MGKRRKAKAKTRRRPKGAKIKHLKIAAVEAMEVFSVRVRHPKDEGGKRRGIYGTVTVICSTYSQDIFNRTEDDCQYIGPGYSDLLLTGPSHCIDSSDLIHILVALKEKGDDPSVYNYPPTHDCSTCTDRFWCRTDARCGSYTNYDVATIPASGGVTFIVWGFYALQFRGYDTPCTLHWVSDDERRCSVEVDYAAFTHAVKANFEVELINDDDNHQFDDARVVFGRITARSSGLTVLFQKEKEKEKEEYILSSNSEGISATRHGVVPITLSRSLVVLSSTSSVLVKVDLRDHNDQRIKGAAKFHVQLDDPSEKIICGGMIRVKVTFAEIKF